MNIAHAFRKWTAYNQTVRELSALDDHMLNDLGIGRGDIQRLAREHANQL